ncbi:heavy-metal-associated domain-containing protein [Clostridiaceae bacterium OttesenSCG-928-D20]|nr:heavy-metal-associated domain-containing protein [Clostridiaceae bacterium OttesenSCG-928-D20]
MKKTFKLTDLDCANCAAKIERNIQKIDGVTDAKVSFMTQKLTLEAEEEKFNYILEEAKRIVKKVEPSCQLV